MCLTWKVAFSERRISGDPPRPKANMRLSASKASLKRIMRRSLDVIESRDIAAAFGKDPYLLLAALLDRADRVRGGLWDGTVQVGQRRG